MDKLTGKIIRYENHVGYWDEDPNYPEDHWKAEVAIGATLMGYWEWVTAQKDAMGRGPEKRDNR